MGWAPSLRIGSGRVVLRRIPEQEPSEDSADGIYGGYLQVATVHVAQVAAHRPVDAHFAGVPPAHVVVGAFHHGFGAFIDEAYRAVFRVVGDLPDAGGCPDQCLIAVRVVNRFKDAFFSALDGGVLVERAGCVSGRFFRVFPRGFPVADVVVTVAVCLALTAAAVSSLRLLQAKLSLTVFPWRAVRRVTGLARLS
ncbi:hypothetical protein [Akkermansia muciniphila]|uniref:hypothetical protein n=1 Tax=Akkermansia muciniphila TaxID=239935 RepID=UPI0013E8E40E|nr:hypothetical protein [Akkermansia muciniphila]